MENKLKIAILAFHDENYREFAKMTLHDNHAEYCKKHGYDLIVEERSLEPNLGFEGIKFVLEKLNYYDWIWYLGADTLIMNHTIKIEDRIDNNYSWIASTHAPAQTGPNSHSYLVKNSEDGKKWMNFIWEMRDSYIQLPWQENQVMIDFCQREPWKQFIKLHPMRYMNSMALGYLAERYSNWREHYLRWNYTPSDDFQIGDWLLHMPGTNLEQRLGIVEHFKPKVIK